MKQRLLLVLANVLTLVALAHAQVTITDADLTGDAEYTWTADTEYLLDGYVYLETGGKLTIEPGTVIKGKAVATNPIEASTLIIARGAQLFAEGTADAPIIFTGELDDLSTTDDLTAADNQTWGGVIILGNSIVGEDEGLDVIEGVPSDETRIEYGGDDPADNSGVLKYVSIRHGGSVLGADNEINGLTLGGVGSATVVDYIEVFANKDDGIEFFGGTVNVTHAVVAFCGDDSYDFDESWNGYVQYALSFQGEASGQGDNAIEYDGTEHSSGMPNESGRIYNGTFIGAGAGAENTKSNGFILKKAGNAQVWNSIFVDQRNYVYEFVDALTPAIAGNIIWNFDGPATLTGPTPATFDVEEIDPLIVVLRGAERSINPVPHSSSPALSGAMAASEDGVDVTEYRGAFDQENWALGWTAMDAYGYFTTVTSVADIADQRIELMQLSPNPVNSKDNVYLDFSLNGAAEVDINVYDITGRLLTRVTRNQSLIAGDHREMISTAQYTPGTYFVGLTTNKGVTVRKLLLK